LVDNTIREMGFIHSTQNPLLLCEISFVALQQRMYLFSRHSVLLLRFWIPGGRLRSHSP
jgi:hypothetical protein